MPPKLSDQMPANQDAKMDSQFPSRMDSDAPPYAGEGGSDDPEVIGCSQATNQGVKWECINDNKPGWEIGTDEQTGPSWETADRKDENDEGGLPQRDPDGDGDLN